MAIDEKRRDKDGKKGKTIFLLKRKRGAFVRTFTGEMERELYGKKRKKERKKERKKRE